MRDRGYYLQALCTETVLYFPASYSNRYFISDSPSLPTVSCWEAWKENFIQWRMSYVVGTDVFMPYDFRSGT